MQLLASFNPFRGGFYLKKPYVIFHGNIIDIVKKSQIVGFKC
jgi:hypothetical protein